MTGHPTPGMSDSLAGGAKPHVAGPVGDRERSEMRRQAYSSCQVDGASAPDQSGSGHARSAAISPPALQLAFALKLVVVRRSPPSAELATR